MISKILYFYRKELGNYKLVFSKIKYWWFSFILFSLVEWVGFMYLLEYTGNIMYLFIVFILYIFQILIINNKAKAIVKKNFNIPQDEFMWGGSSYNKFKEDRFKVYLVNELSINKLDKFKQLHEIINKEIDKTKLNIFFIPGVFITLFLPLWNQYITLIFKSSATLVEASKYFVTALFVIIMVTLVVSVGRMLNNDLISFRRSKLKEIETLLEGIILEHNDCNS
ncbi:hypothetical protein [Cohnella cholangitidis]|uniref:Uncharacterized protein n=1 Tax=Cohnella cholangitidis TaxID=2598458 RepID=A0A7G5BSY9_9BACL|nr:hypothetical protein [Cohnella cholangitidis]QMV40073.1 hypothetical protein FPL14_01810 [Cohnella cholangitidis]